MTHFPFTDLRSAVAFIAMLLTLCSLTERQSRATLYTISPTVNMEQGTVTETFERLKTKCGNMEAGCELKATQVKARTQI